MRELTHVQLMKREGRLVALLAGRSGAAQEDSFCSYFEEIGSLLTTAGLLFFSAHGKQAPLNSFVKVRLLGLICFCFPLEQKYFVG